MTLCVMSPVQGLSVYLSVCLYSRFRLVLCAVQQQWSSACLLSIVLNMWRLFGTFTVLCSSYLIMIGAVEIPCYIL